MLTLVSASTDNLFMRVLKFFCCCFFDASSFWEFKRAPEPTDINWENLGIGTIRKLCQRILVWGWTVIILIVCAVCINAIKVSEEKYRKE